MREVTIFFATVLVLYFASRHTINEIFYFFYCLIGNKKISFWLISIIFFPGTLIHELSHFFLAMILFLPLVGLDIFPKFEGQSIKLGSVHYVKKDFLRGFIVGIAPFFGAILFFWLISHLPMNLFSYYLIFVVSSTMFSSKKDLEDLLYLIPLTLIIAAIFYVFNVSPIPFLDQLTSNKTLIKFIDTINHYLFVSLMINLLIFGILRLMRLLIKNFFKIC
jgi:hypothetical protein